MASNYKKKTQFKPRDNVCIQTISRGKFFPRENACTKAISRGKTLPRDIACIQPLSRGKVFPRENDCTFCPAILFVYLRHKVPPLHRQIRNLILELSIFRAFRLQ